jgi:ubiquinone/menaquinone biosynthesis C-methylase UbiE
MSSDSRGHVRSVYDRQAHRYDRAIRPVDRLLLGDGRAWAAAQAHGITLEIGVGTGLNLPLYDRDIHLIGVDLSPAMLAQAARRQLRQRPTRLQLVEADASALPLPDASVDTVVSTLVFCGMPTPTRALAEARRVLRPGGRLVMLDHVAADNRTLRAAQRALEPLAQRLAADSLLRDPTDDVIRLGMTVLTRQRSRAGLVQRLLATT